MSYVDQKYPPTVQYQNWLQAEKVMVQWINPLGLVYLYVCTYTLFLAFELDICSGNGKTVGKITAASMIYCKHNSSLMTWLWPSSPDPFKKTLAQPWWMKPQKNLAFPIKSCQMACL